MQLFHLNMNLLIVLALQHQRHTLDDREYVSILNSSMRAGFNENVLLKYYTSNKYRSLIQV